jgi:SAM-dependent methyltransferase
LRLDDPEVVRREYASEAGLAGRSAAYRFAEGPNPNDLALQAVAEVRPRRVLEVGPGRGEFAARLVAELGVDVLAVDQSGRMVELTRGRGIDARVGDVQELPLGDGEFDCCVANWMLYHVPDLDRALAELRRVLRPGGRLVAVTNGGDHLHELYELLEVGKWTSSFAAEDAPKLVRRHFARVESRDATGWIVFPGRDEAQAYVDAAESFAGAARQLPPFAGPLRVRRRPFVLVADA